MSQDSHLLRMICRYATTRSTNEPIPYLLTLISGKLAKNVLAYTLLTDGIPIVYQGQEQHLSGNGTPYNREALWTTSYNTSATLYTFTQTLNQIRTQAIFSSTNYTTYNNYVIYQDLHTLAMRKGYNGSQIITVLSNLGVFGSNYTLSLSATETGYTAGMDVTELLGCTNTTVDNSNTLEVRMGQGLPKVFYPTELLAGSGMCGTIKTVPTTSGFITPGGSPPSSPSSPIPSRTPLGKATSTATPTWFHMFASTLAVFILQYWLA
ncbi:MAG: hypothetical protein Q9157_004413 [Trypethelium eluteriae]